MRALLKSLTVSVTAIILVVLFLPSCKMPVKSMTLWGHPDPSPINDHPDVMEFLVDSITTTKLEFRDDNDKYYSSNPTCELKKGEISYLTDVGGGNSIVTMDSLSLSKVFAGASRFAVVQDPVRGEKIVKVGVIQYRKHVRKWKGRFPRTVVIYEIN